MGDENTAFDEDTDDEETSAQRIECILCHDAHEGEEGSQPVDGEEEKIDADDSSRSFPELEVGGQKACREENCGDNTDNHDGPRNLAVVKRSESED